MRSVFNILSAILFTFIIAGCNSSNQEKSPSEDSTKTQPQQQEPTADAGKDIVGTSDGLIIREIQKNELRVFGKYVSSPITKIKELVNSTVPDIMNQIHQRQLILGGTLMLIYPDNNPTSSTAKLFIGIPVKVKKPVAGYEYLEFPQGNYFKATVNAEPGTSTGHWKKFIQELETKGLKFTGPYYEYYSDSRNTEMATTITNTSLLVKKQ